MASSKAEAKFQRENAGDFPRLTASNFTITSPQTWRYNCIAWASGDDTRWWWPINRYWPGGAPKTTSVSAFVMMFETQGYAEAESETFEPGFEKIALYADNLGRVTHAARQLPNGSWTSKLGQHCDISHTLDGLEGKAYGSVSKLLKRPISTEPASPD